MSGAVAGLLLTGGRSTRMGRDKANLLLDGETLAVRVGSRLAAVASPAIEVGPGVSGLPVARTPDPGEGPLPALVAGWGELTTCGHSGPVLLLATDLPFVTVELLAWLAERPGSGSVVPVVDGAPQVLCARWSKPDLVRAAALVERGERSVRSALGEEVDWVGERDWGSVATSDTFADLDDPSDLERFGLRGA